MIRHLFQFFNCDPIPREKIFQEDAFSVLMIYGVVIGRLTARRVD